VKKSGILNPELAKQIAMMGHFDKVCIADAGLPIPAGATRIDLALVAGLPLLSQVLEALQVDFEVQEVILARETDAVSPAVSKLVEDLWPDAESSRVSHNEFKELLAECRFVIRTGEFTPYANVILVSGVPF